jgi:hypothetical protein
MDHSTGETGHQFGNASLVSRVKEKKRKGDEIRTDSAICDTTVYPGRPWRIHATSPGTIAENNEAWPAQSPMTTWKEHPLYPESK